MVDYIGPIFEELKTDGRKLKTNIDTKMYHLEVLMEFLEQKILGALKTYCRFSKRGNC